jgi:hypothetical protein
MKNDRTADLTRFYAILDALEERAGARTLAECSGPSNHEALDVLARVKCGCYGASSEQIMPWHAPVTAPSLSPRSLISLRRAAHVTKVARR